MGEGGAAATPAKLTGGILVGYDGSQASRPAVRWAADMALRLGLPLHVLRAWTLTNAPRPESMTGGYVPPKKDFEDACVAAVRADLDALGLPEGIETQLHAVHGRSSTRLLEAAADGVDMLVVGARGAGGFRGLGFGSTADQVVRHAPCPVVVVPSPRD
jgi:nucleotide-binding universal stress UspA family protein